MYLLLVVLLCSITGIAAATSSLVTRTNGDYTYKLDSDWNAIILKWQGSDKKLDIPIRWMSIL